MQSKKVTKKMNFKKKATYMLGVLPLVASPAFSQNSLWIGPNEGNFWEGINWNTNKAPIDTDGDIIINGSYLGDTIHLLYDETSPPLGSDSNTMFVGQGSGNHATLQMAIDNSSGYLYPARMSLDLILGDQGGNGTLNLQQAEGEVGPLRINSTLLGNGTGSQGTINLLGSGKQIASQKQGESTVQVTDITIATNGGQGILNVDGASIEIAGEHRNWNNTDSYVFSLGQGHNSIGQVNVLGGGKLATSVYLSETLSLDQSAVVGLQGGTGVLNISGMVMGDNGNLLHSRAIFSEGLAIGKDDESNGVVNITEGGLLRTTSSNESYYDSSQLSYKTQIGVNGGTGSVLVSGAESRWEVAGFTGGYEQEDMRGNPGELYLGDSGTGTLTITDNAVVAIGRVKRDSYWLDDPDLGSLYWYDYDFVSEAGTLKIATQAGSQGILNIGAALTENAAVAGRLEADFVAFGEGQGQIVFNHTDSDYRFNPKLSGTGTLIQKSGTTWLAADNTNFSGNILMQGGTLGADNDHSFGNSVVKVQDTSTLAYANGVSLANSIEIGAPIVRFDSNATVTLNAFVDQNEVATQTGVISGSGDFQKTGQGMLTLTAANTLTGLVTVREGILALEENASLANAERVDVSSGGSFDVTAQPQSSIQRLSGSGYVNILDAKELIITNANQNDEFSGQLIGTGIFTLNNGVQRLTGDSFRTFTGGATVNGGTLAVEGALGGTMFVNSGGTLAGAGTVGQTIIRSGGVITLGAYGSVAPSQITVAGNLTLEAGSIYSLNINPTSSDLINVLGSANINKANVLLAKEGGVYRPGSRWQILKTTEGLSGGFGALNQDLPFVNFVYEYDANSAYLTVNRNEVDFCVPGMNSNECSVGNNLDTNTTHFLNWLIASQLSIEDAKNALNQLSGELYASVKATTFEDSRFLREAVNSRLMTASQSEINDVWVHGFGSWANIKAETDRSNSVKRDIGGIFAGVDKQLNEHWRVGIVGGYSRANIQAKDIRSSAHRDDYHVGAYLGGEWDAFKVRSGFGYTWHNFSSKRDLAFPGLVDHVSAKYHGSTTQAFVEASYTVKLGKSTQLEPFVNGAYVYSKLDGFSERGGSAILNAKNTHDDLFYSTAGLRVSHNVDLKNGGALNVWGSVGWRHAFGGSSVNQTDVYFQNATSFRIAGTPIAKNTAVLELGLEAKLTPSLKLGIQYNGQIGKKTKDHGAKVGLTWNF